MSRLQPHWATYLRQFEAAACANNWTENDKAVSLVLTLKGDVYKRQEVGVVCGGRGLARGIQIIYV